ncbi:MAG: metallophosphoesterase family protein [Acutalibacteraceae bacterium]
MENLHFKNGRFKIMQIADVQENAVANPDTIKLISLAVEKEKPDLVVFTGDQVKGYSPSFRKNTKENVERLISSITEPITKNNIPFAVTFGNHDRDCGISNKEQMQFYLKLDGCIKPVSRNDDDAGTYSLQINDSDNKRAVFALYIIDSNAKMPDGDYAPVTKEQIDWYKNERDRLKQENSAYLPALVFQHIPLPEYYNAIKKASFFTKGRVEAFGSRKNEFYVLFDESEKDGGFMLESPAAPEINNGEFDAFKEKGDVLGVFVGHDHNNSFVKNVDGIDLGYTQGCGFSTYGPGKKRGVRIFVLNEDKPTEYETYTVTMEELCDFKPSAPFSEFILTHAPSSVAQVKSTAKRIGKAAAVLSTAGLVLYKIFKK